ncbi:hypothetical protein P43SY_003231 [Pythium insidiosum]|uniref:Tetratricopeptide repeat protein n=1 Tax=Pythium insidiosum TaxID=114742 RepID=A0AAD5LN12_PYTIN|nr:hypothetical protein P43SY_003231 [Pythium insidiosum]
MAAAGKQYVADDDAREAEMEQQRQLQASLLGLKQQADHLIMTSQFADAARLYRELLMQLTRSQVKVAEMKDLVVSCHMNVLAALSKLEQWREIPSECDRVDALLRELGEHAGQDPSLVQIQGRVHYFRGTALSRMGAFAPAAEELRAAMQLLPNLDAIKSEYEEVERAMAGESRVKELIATAMKHFQGGEVKQAMETSLQALRACEKLGKAELTGLVHSNLAAAYASQEQFDDAIKHYTAALDLARMMDSSSSSSHRFDRLYDLYDGLASCHARRNDLPAAYQVVQQTLPIFDKCTGRQDQAYAFFMNAGRVCFASNKFDEAEAHLTRAEREAPNVAGTLQALTWLGKSYVEQKETDKLEALLARADECQQQQQQSSGGDAAAISPDIPIRLMVLWMFLLESRVNESGTLSAAHNARVDAMLASFRDTHNYPAYMQVARIWITAAPDGATQVARLDEALELAHSVPAEQFSGGVIDGLMGLTMMRVEHHVRRGDPAGARALLRRALLDPAKKKVLPPMAIAALLCRFADVCGVEPVRDSYDADDVALLEGAHAILQHQAQQEPEAQPLLATTLVVIAQWKTRHATSAADMERAVKMLEQAVTLRRATAESQPVLLGEALVGLCVVLIRRGDRERAASILRDAEQLPGLPEEWKEQLAPLQEQLADVAESVKEKPKKKKKKTPSQSQQQQQKETAATSPKKQANPTVEEAETLAAEEEQASSELATAPRSALMLWWDEWWFAVSVLLVAIVFAYAMTL